MRKILFPLFVLLLLYAAVEIRSGFHAVLRVRDGEIITFGQMMEEVKKVNVVFVGEIHDDINHHRLQLAIISALHESGTTMAIGLEMFRWNSGQALDAWVRGRSSLEHFLPIYYDNWNQPWPLYRNIFYYSREHEIPLIGLNIPEDIAKAVSLKGFDSLSNKQKKILPPGISCNVDPTYMDFIRRAYGDHPAKGKGGRRFVHFCEAQMVWDKSMAWHLAQYLKKNPDRTLVVLAGVGHAWKRGIPEQLTMESALTYRVILPLVPDQIEKTTVTTRDADYVLLHGNFSESGL